VTRLLHLSDALFLRINDLARASTGLHAPAVAYARYGLVVFAALILLGVWRRRGASDRDLAAAVWAGAGTVLAVAVNQPVAALVAEPRPYAVHPAALTLVDRTTDWSFPSDHSVMAGAAAVGLLLVSRRLPWRQQCSWRPPGCSSAHTSPTTSSRACSSAQRWPAWAGSSCDCPSRD